MSEDRQGTYHYIGAQSQTHGWEKEQPLFHAKSDHTSLGRLVHEPTVHHRDFYRQYKHHVTEPYRRLSPGDHHDEHLRLPFGEMMRK